MVQPFVSAILLAYGKGTRMGNSIPKQFLPLGSIPLCLWSYNVFCQVDAIKEIIVICEEPYRKFFNPPPKASLKFSLGGPRRQDSVFEGLNQTHFDSQYCLIHDSARPCLTAQHLKRFLDEGLKYPASTLGVPSKSTLKRVDKNGFCIETLNREEIWEIQTPQLIQTSLLKKAFQHVHAHQLDVTDDVSLVEHLGEPVKILPGFYENIKVTTPSDLTLASLILGCPSE